MKKNIKLLAILVSFVLIIAAFAIVATAEETTQNVAKIGDVEYATITEAFTASKAGDTIVLIGDASTTASYSLYHDINIDLNGHTVNVSGGFINVKADVNISITGEGKFIQSASLIYAGDDIFPNVKIESLGAPMQFESTNGASIVNVASGNYTLSNLSVTANMSSASNNSAVFRTGGNRVSAHFDITGVYVKATGIPKDSSGKSLTISVVRLNGSSTCTLNYCNMTADNTIVQVNAGTAGSTILTVNNSYLYSNRAHDNGNSGNTTGVIGNGAAINGHIYINDSYIRGSYKPINLSTDGTGTVYLNNSIVLHNGTNGNGITSNANLRVNGTSYIGLPKTGTLTGSTTGFIMLEEGARLNKSAYDSYVSNAKGIKFVEKNTDNTETLVDPIDSTLTIAYDPVGNATAPYVVVRKELAESGGVDNIPGKVFYADGSGLPTEKFYSNGFSSTPDDELTPTLIWNHSGEMKGVSIDGNIALEYKKNTTNKGTNIITGFKNTIAQSSIDAMVVEFDIATNSSSGFSPMNLTLHSRSAANPGGGSGRQRQLIKIAADGAVTSAFTSAKDTKNTYLSTQEWNHITIVVDTAVFKGRVYVYVNGDLIGSGEAYSGEDAYIAGPRFDITASSTSDFSFLLDNLLVRSFGDGSSTNAMKNPENYLMNGGKAWNKGIVNNSYTHTLEAGKMAITDVNEIASDSDVTAYLNRDYTSGNPVKTNVRVATCGKKFAILNGSTAFDTIYSASGELLGYDFNSKYASAKVTFKWFIGNINNPKNLLDESLWVCYESNSGIIPSTIYNTLNQTPKLISKGYTYTFATVTGWDFDTEKQYDYTFARNNPTIEIKPVYNEENPSTLNYTYAVLDSDGCFVRGGTTTSLFGSGWYKNDNGTITGVQLTYGETFVFLSDNLVVKGNFQTGARGTESEGKTFSFDFNGHTITFKSSENTTGKKGNYFTAQEGETFNFYSSLPGAEVKLAGLNGDTSTDASAGYFFTVTGQNYTYVDENGKTQEDKAAILENINKTETDNIKAYIGTVTAFGTTYPGSNLAIYGDNLVRLTRGDKSCSVNVDGITFVRITDTARAAFLTERYSGELNVTNANIVSAVNGSIVESIFSTVVNDTNGNGKLDSGEIRALCRTSFINCLIILSANTASEDDYSKDNTLERTNVVAGNWGYEKIYFENCVTNGRFNPSHLGNVCVLSEGNVSSHISIGNFDEVVKARYNLPMTFGTLTNESTFTAYVLVYDAETKTYTEEPFIIAAYGTAAEEASLTLPILTHKTVKESDAVTLTVLGLDGKEISSVLYAKGAAVTTELPELDSYNGAVLTLVHNGWEEALPETITESFTAKPTYTVAKHISGVRVNLSIYSDFNINLYVPIALKEYLAAGEDSLAYTEVDTDGDGMNDSLKFVIEIGCDEATKDVTFALSFTELGEVVNTAYTISIADYAKAIYDGDYTEDDDKLMYYMIAYATEAAEYFGKDTEELDALLEYLSGAKDTVSHDFTDAISNVNLGGAFDSATVDLKSAPEFILTLKQGFVGTITISYGTNVRTYTIDDNHSGMIAVTGMKVYNFGSTLVINAEGTVNGNAVKTENAEYNLDTFVKYHVENASSGSATATESAKCLDLLLAFYDYVTVADAYTK